MALLAELPELVGFFSYSREDDEDSNGKLSALRGAIGSELAQHLGRSKRRDFQLWQDQAAIAAGDDWESEISKAIGQAAFFIPIVTPRAVASRHCKFEFESFLARESELGRDDLIFPILYVPVPALLDEAKWRNDPVLSIVGKRQHFDWRRFRHVAPETTVYGEAIESFCEQIVAKLREPWVSPEERRQLEAEAKKRAEDEERFRQETDARRQAEERVRLRKEAIAKKRAEEEARERQEAETKRRGEEEEQERVRKEALAKMHLAPLTAAEERALKPGDSFKEGPDCPEMIVVPAGRFLMGSPEGQGNADEHPQHEVTIARPFALAKFALTFDEWDACAARGGCRSDVSDNGWGRGRRPAINVTWDDAQAYVKWLSSVTGKPYRLLSEAEHEYAARAGSETKYPWGDDIKLDGQAMANCYGCGSQWDDKQTAPVGSFAANRFGLNDMVGNVSAWTEDCWNNSYKGAPTDGSPWTSDARSSRVVRGGSWIINPDSLRSANRNRASTVDRGSALGFRVARTLTP
ncbi:MAG: SUMF1/EgtB/PvdO family nonheme iron enzyme [Hyphomicrobiales bacterium]|nr:SUMF1/EgtB/PvdO family nonheme iron enzyme [Hyphomicrobiales bacterium]